MSALTKSLRRPTSPQTLCSRDDAEGATAVVLPSTPAVAPPPQGLKPIGSTFANLAALYRAKAGE